MEEIFYTAENTYNFLGIIPQLTIAERCPKERTPLKSFINHYCFNDLTPGEGLEFRVIPGERFTIPDISKNDFEGGISKVHLGFDSLTAQKVVVKIMKDIDPSQTLFDGTVEDTRRLIITSMIEESAILANNPHPNVARILDFTLIPNNNESSDLSYLPAMVCEYIDGEKASTLLERIEGFNKSLIREEEITSLKLDLLKVVAEVIDYYSERGLSILDIKLENIIIPKDINGNFDFKNAQIIDIGGTQGTIRSKRQTKGVQVITPPYSAPETLVHTDQVEKDKVDKAPIHALGVLAYLLFGGNKDSFINGENFSSLHTIEQQELNFESSETLKNNPKLQIALSKATGFYPNRRQSNAKDLANDIELALAI